ncbi:MAG: hypothetical protein OEY34_06555 [Cyclobacteriaceae bacterium]|nr:hypothetical protein [Cyclobacteriaceae bacterium]
MKQAILFFILIVVKFTVYGQNLNSSSNLRMINLGLEKSNVEYEYKEIKGTPYVNDEFKPGTIYYSNAEPVEIKLRFNIYDNVIQYMEGGKLYELIINERFLSAEVNGLKLVHKNYFEGTEIKGGLLVELIEGNYSMYKMLRVELKEAVERTSSYEEQQPPTFERMQDKYYLAHNNKMYFYNRSKKSLPEIFQEDYPRVQEIMNKRKLNTKKEADMIELISTLNTGNN